MRSPLSASTLVCRTMLFIGKQTLCDTIAGYKAVKFKKKAMRDRKMLIECRKKRRKKIIQKQKKERGFIDKVGLAPKESESLERDIYV